MTHYLGLVLAITLSSVHLSSTGYQHDLKRFVWSSGKDPDGIFNSDAKAASLANLEPPDFGNKAWTYEGKEKLLKSSKNTGFSVVESWPDASKKLGQLSAVSFDVDGNIVVFHRGDRIWDGNTFLTNNVYNQRILGPISQPTVVVFNGSSGLVVEEWGNNTFYLPHGLTVDMNNSVWVTDVALHQVLKFPQGGGTPLLTLGVAFVPGNDDDHFCKPTAVAVMSAGDFFVSDGYCNTRIIKFNRDGKFLMQWGRNSFQAYGVRMPPYEFSVPHALALAEDKEMLCVADRENGRIQCFNCHNGSFIVQLHSHEMGSRIFSVAYSPAQGGLLIVVNGPEFLGGGLVSGFVISLRSNQVMEAFSPNGQGFSNPHDVAVNKDGSQVYVVELDPYKVWKFVKAGVHQH
ncbi:peptidyl-alpha-hydroxyglycine alpha-amidating lyase 1 isoform X2 [Zootermopsis nevadensis]|uniref:peptidylamidoglycolate lyase n=1 Tax=Zootermopsis nevadensis TaxID=136037 RepID=A0A067RHL7_ZOONE|nr:peptidyl-alpha-hydroxyglycine alpha-amidating lyase 1 isoform X2 [Zootermopsis nevadensis]KDR18657.1 Peptidyl-alpha-hydroxyglycine alpha-amidating lyase 1 [Zootermopsis nevadensis]